MGFVQIDSINIVERAHHLTLAARLQGYRPALLAPAPGARAAPLRALDPRRLGHPHDLVPLLEGPLRALPPGVLEHPWWMERVGPDPERVIDHVRERIVREGPLMTRTSRTSGRRETDKAWWGGSRRRPRSNTSGAPASWRSPSGSTSTRSTTSPSGSFPRPTPPPGRATRSTCDWACRSALERLGIASADELAGFWRAVSLEEARAWCERAAAAGEIAAVRGGDRRRLASAASWAVPDWEARAAALPPAPPRVRLLSPFDPILRDRKRTLRLFNFDYRFEAFVPEPQRRHGYYVLPILEGERLVGRLDPKLHRERGAAGGPRSLVGARRAGEQGAEGGAGSRPRPAGETGRRRALGDLPRRSLPPRPLQRLLHQHLLAGSVAPRPAPGGAGRRCRRAGGRGP